MNEDVKEKVVSKELRVMLLINFFYYTQQMLIYVLRFFLSLIMINVIGKYVQHLCVSSGGINPDRLAKIFYSDVYRYSYKVALLSLFLFIACCLLKLISINVPIKSLIKMAFRDSSILCVTSLTIHQEFLPIMNLLNGENTRFRHFLLLIAFLIVDYYLIQKLLISIINQDILLVEFDNTGNPKVVFKVDSSWEKYLRVDRWNMQKEASFISNHTLMNIFEMESEGLIPVYRKSLYSDATIKIKYCPVEIRARGKVVSETKSE